MGKEEQKTEEFKPRGAMAFFVALMLLFMVIYFGMYFLMLSRG